MGRCTIRTTVDRNRTGNFRHSNQCRLFGLHEGIRDLKGVDIMTYARLKKLIERGAYNKEDMLNKMDVFLMANRITEEQYQELVGMMG